MRPYLPEPRMPWSALEMLLLFADDPTRSPSRATSNKVHVLLSYDVPTRTLEIYLDGDLIRAAHAFGPKAPELTSSDRQEQLEGKTNQVFVGVMACSPRGGGTEVKFSNFGWMDGALTPE